MTFLSRVQRRHLPGQIVIARPGGELVHTHRHNTERRFRARGGHADPGVRPRVHQVCRTAGLEIGRGYAK